MKLSAIIPARLNSKRLPQKVLKKINDIPMIEHVRRKIVLSKMFDDVTVVTSDLKIKQIIEKYNGKVIINKNKHFSGTSRSSEIVNKIEGDVIVIIFADELLISLEQIKQYCISIKKDKTSECWNATAMINEKDLLDDNIVKCEVNKENFIKYFSRKKIKLSSKNKIVKSVGMISFKKNFLIKYSKLNKTKNEKETKIEQFRILDNDYSIKSIYLKKVYNSINTYRDFKYALKFFKN